MPTYEYRCSECGNTFDIVQRIGDDTLTVCERCGGKLRKVFHPAGIVFKGSGFYATDSRSKAKAGSNEGKDKKAEKTEGSDKKEIKTTEKKSDSKKPSSSESSS